MKSGVEKYTAVAEKYNEPGKFTAMIGYEWTSVPKGNNLHRNILFRDGKARADQVFPFSAWNSEDRRSCGPGWTATSRRPAESSLRSRTTRTFPTAGMFETVDFAGKALTKDYARAALALGGTAGDRPDEGREREATR